jgi:hypothetical protein
VLPLLPETLYVGLFSGHCTLQRGRKAPVLAWATPTTLDLAAILQTVEKVLEEQERPVRKGARLVVTVSDSIAAIAPLPWQTTLTRPAEIDSYARICYEKLGMTIDESWVMRAEFRHFGGVGLAYALPRVWVDALAALAHAKGLQLITVLPLSAAAYCKQRVSRKAGTTLLLLQEANRMSAMTYNKDGLLGYDVEPYTRSRDETLVRLLRRMASVYTNVTRVSSWSTDVAQSTVPTEIISASFPECASDSLPHDSWN